MQSNLDRVKAAEGLIESLPETHEGRNTWLMNYGIREKAQAIRDNDPKKQEDAGYRPRELTWNDETECLKAQHNAVITSRGAEVMGRTKAVVHAQRAIITGGD